MKLNFTKWHGCGNDFILIDAMQLTDIDTIINQASTLCNRHFGIGGDGLIFILPSTQADFKMRIINSDGSEPEMCGNGIRCFAKAVHHYGLTDKHKITVETGAGIIIPELMADGRVRVDMGAPILEGERIPVAGYGNNPIISQKITADNHDYLMTCVSMGNPHCVIFVDDINSVALAHIGPVLETHPAFPRKINVEFVQVRSPQEMRMRVWERGAGITWACGTGTCASHVAAHLNKLVGDATEVELDGGYLRIEWNGTGHVYMTGPAEQVFTGIWED